VVGNFINFKLRGICLGPNKCSCTTILYIGDDCENIGALIALIVVLTSVCLLSILFIIIIISVICILSIIIISLSIYFNKKNKNIQTKNKELNDKLLMMNDLNKIQFKDIKIDKINGKQVILGKGASSIVNFIYLLKGIFWEI
jgi:hypothetical protein